MIWILIILVIMVISFILALRSMKSYKEIPTTKYSYGLYLVQNEDLLFNNGLLNKLYEFSLESNAIISIERLFKGSQRALVIYAPRNISQFVPEIELLEIEDYLVQSPKDQQKKVPIDNMILWSITPKNESEIEIKPDFMKSLNLDENQNFFWQLVLSAAKKEYHFQVNIRAIVAEPDVHQRVELAKKVNEYINEGSKLEKKSGSQSISTLFEEYQKRSMVPFEAEGFILSTQAIKHLI